MLLKTNIPIRTVSASNMREHWAVRARRVKSERDAARAALFGCCWRPAELGRLLTLNPVIRLTRVAGPRGKELDDDNLRGALKAVRDGVADWLQIDDNDPRVSWYYAQSKGLEWRVDVEVFA